MLPDDYDTAFLGVAYQGRVGFPDKLPVSVNGESKTYIPEDAARAIIKQLAEALEMARSGAVFKHPQIAVAVADALTAARPYLQEAGDE